jgi:ankyrin repeat protein
MWAARAGQTQAATILLENGADASAINEYEATAMHEAVDGNHVEVVQVLVERHTNPNTRDGRGNTPLMLAARSGHVEVIRALMDGPTAVELEIQNKDGQTALTWAVVNGHIKVVRLLMQLGSDPMTLDADDRGILAITASTGQENLMKAMLESILGASSPEQITQSMQKAARMFSQKDSAGNTCLMAAVRHSGTRGGDPAEAEAAALDCCKVVMQHESGLETIDMVNNDGDTALIGAVRENRVKVCEYLIDHGADRSVPNKWDMTAEFLGCVAHPYFAEHLHTVYRHAVSGHSADGIFLLLMLLLHARRREMGHDECAALCAANRRAKRTTRGESFANSGSPQAGAASTEPTISDIAEGAAPEGEGGGDDAQAAAGDEEAAEP